jgi:hypothetical protein
LPDGSLIAGVLDGKPEHPDVKVNIAARSVLFGGSGLDHREDPGPVFLPDDVAPRELRPDYFLNGSTVDSIGLELLIMPPSLSSASWPLN